MTYQEVLLGALRAPHAPRVVTPESLARHAKPFLARQGLAWTSHAAETVLPKLATSGLLRRVQRGLYLNMLAQPPVTADEAAPFLRPGARISLQRLLGLAGVANNPSRIITAVVPLPEDGAGPSLGIVDTAVGRFRFHGIREGIANAAREEDRLIAPWARPLLGEVALATPEQALVDWIYLANARRSARMGMPPAWDMEGSMLDRRRLIRCAKAAGVLDETKAWLEECLAAREEQDEGLPRPSGSP